MGLLGLSACRVVLRPCPISDSGTCQSNTTPYVGYKFGVWGLELLEIFRASEILRAFPHSDRTLRELELRQTLCC